VIEGLLSKISGRQHHFKLVIHYVPDRMNASHYAERIMTAWMPERSNIADERQIKKMVGESLVANIPRHRRNNGHIDIRAVYYLGWFKPKEPKP